MSRRWAKKDRCWEHFKTQTIGIPATLLRPVITQREISRAGTPVAGRMDNSEAYARIRLVPADEWFAISGWAKETGNLLPWQRALAYGLGRLAAQNKEPSTKQVTKVRRFLTRSGGWASV